MQLGDDLRACASREIVAEDPLPRFRGIVVNRVPERVGGDLRRVTVLGHHVHQRNAAGTQIGKERRRALDDRAAALGGQRQRRHGRIEMAAVHVDGDDGGARGIEPDHQGESVVPVRGRVKPRRRDFHRSRCTRLAILALRRGQMIVLSLLVVLVLTEVEGVPSGHQLTENRRAPEHDERQRRFASDVSGE